MNQNRFGHFSFNSESQLPFFFVKGIDSLKTVKIPFTHIPNIVTINRYLILCHTWEILYGICTNIQIVCQILFVYTQTLQSTQQIELYYSSYHFKLNNTISCHQLTTCYPFQVLTLKGDKNQTPGKPVFYRHT